VNGDNSALTSVERGLAEHKFRNVVNPKLDLFAIVLVAEN
jgi:hypothetical protein